MIEVVAAALVRGDQVLAARRSAPHRFAGGWEFPGGKLEPGEDDPTALVRECREELGVGIEVGPRLETVTRDGISLTLYGATLLCGSPRPLEDHDELRWLAAADLHSVAWLPIDLVLVHAVDGYLQERNRRGRL